jgi:ribosomal protein S18 acetylase RimI-like enzyme
VSGSTQPGVDRPVPSWLVVAPASPEDVPGIVVAVQELLRELGSTPPPTPALEEVARELIADRNAGAVFIALADREIIGVLAASWQLAMHVPGRYATIQDLWVHPTWRSRAIGSKLIDALVEIAHARGMARIEVGLPRENFHAIRLTEAFYLDNGFTPLGPRMRRLLS